MSHPTLRLFSPGFPGNHVRVEEKSKSCEGIASLVFLSPLSLFLTVCVCIKTSLPMLSLHSQLSISSHGGQTQDRGEGRGTRPKENPVRHFFDLPSYCLPFSSLFLTFSSSLSVYWISLLSSSSSFFFLLSVSNLLGQWLHPRKMGCGNSSATSTSGGGESFRNICMHLYIFIYIYISMCVRA